MTDHDDSAVGDDKRTAKLDPATLPDEFYKRLGRVYALALVRYEEHAVPAPEPAVRRDE